MKHKFLLSILFTILLGIILANYTYYRYQENYTRKPDFYYIKQTKKVGEQGKQLSSSLTTTIEDNEVSILGMTKDKRLAEIIKTRYEENHIIVEIKEGTTDNKEFLNELSQYDILLDNASSFEETESILKTVLATFEETIGQK